MLKNIKDFASKNKIENFTVRHQDTYESLIRRYRDPIVLIHHRPSHINDRGDRIYTENRSFHRISSAVLREYLHERIIHFTPNNTTQPYYLHVTYSNSFQEDYLRCTNDYILHREKVYVLRAVTNSFLILLVYPKNDFPSLLSLEIP